MATIAENKVIVNFDGDLSVKNVIQTTVRVLRQARQENKANEFQKEVVSGKPMMDVVKNYVTIA